MIKSGKIGLYIVAMLSFAMVSCEKEEKPYTLPAPGPARVDQVNMGSSYDKVIFYDLASGKSVVKEVAAWDLSFESGEDGKYVFINGGTGVLAFASGKTNFSDLIDVSAATWKWDSPDGNPDSAAIGDWTATDGSSRMEVYLIDRGSNAAEQYKKLQIMEVNRLEYRIRTANLDGSNEQSFTVPKDPRRNFVYLNMDKGVIVDFEPDKEDWDIVFTRYRHVYYDMDPVVPYELNGVLLNPNNVEAAEERKKPFDEINREQITDYVYSRQRDFIGFDWKYYDFDAASYITDLNRTFMLRSHAGVYFKLRFIDFYDQNGVKGAPSFEVQAL
jgi:hypothetical protein